MLHSCLKRSAGLRLGIAVALLLFLPPLPVASETLRIQSAFPRGDLSMELLQRFAVAAGEKSGGQLSVEVFADPEIVPMEQLFGAVQRGTIQMLQGAGVLWRGIIPAANIEFGLPMAYRIDRALDFEAQARKLREFFYREGFVALLRKEYADRGLYLLDIHTYGPVPFVLATAPLRTCDDLKGRRIRSDGLNHAFHAGVGMQGVSMSALETYAALRRGDIDAAGWDVSAVTGLRWQEAAPYWIRGFENDQCLGHILVNLETWTALTPEKKDALRAAGEAYWHATVRGYKKEMETVRRLIRQKRLTEVWLEPACREAYGRVARNLWDQAAAEDETSARLVEILKKWHAVPH